MNISNTISNLFNVVFIALGDSVAIVVGQLLGAGKMEEAKDTDRKMIVFSVMCCTGVALVMLVIAPLFPQLYNTKSRIQRTGEVFHYGNCGVYANAGFSPRSVFYPALRWKNYCNLLF